MIAGYRLRGGGRFRFRLHRLTEQAALREAIGRTRRVPSGGHVPSPWSSVATGAGCDARPEAVTVMSERACKLVTGRIIAARERGTYRRADCACWR